MNSWLFLILFDLSEVSDVIIIQSIWLERDLLPNGIIIIIIFKKIHKYLLF